VEPVADEDRRPRRDRERVESPLEDLGVRLAPPDLGREDGVVDPLRDPGVREVAVQERGRVERVRDDAE
jgi:hypothetical protein